VDARASTGSGLRYLVEFGDGTTTTDEVAQHVYDAAGAYRVTLTVTDASGRTATRSRPLVVASPVGVWLYSGYLARAHAVEVRTLTLTAQDGLTVRGLLKTARERETVVTGTLTPDRRIRLAVDHPSETLEGVVPSVLSGDRAVWTLTSRGGPADGETLTYIPRIGEPSGPPPDAVLKMRFFSFSAPFAIKEISPILFDGSTSRGEGLTYFIEFGDRQVATTATAVHSIDEVGNYTARLTTVDRFGRSNVETAAYEVRTLVTNCDYCQWQGMGTYYLTIGSQSGTAITGLFHDYNVSPPVAFTGTVDADGDVRLRLANSNVTLVGTMTLAWRDYESNRLVLTYVGGPRNGQTLSFYYRNGY
jgi:PKD repeat protein